MDSLDRDNTTTYGASAAPNLSRDSKDQLLNLASDQPIPEFNIQLSPWDALDWENKAATASLPYTPCATPVFLKCHSFTDVMTSS